MQETNPTGATQARTLDGGRVRIDAGDVDALAASIDGTVVRPGGQAYAEMCSIWNAMIDRKPALGVRCRHAADVANAVRFVREQGLLASVKGAGHNIAGQSLCDGGIVIDLSHMKGIRIDPRRRTARAQPGVVWGELDRATQLHGLATPGGIVSTTGTSGFTLGGGFGYLTRKFGYTCDNLASVDVVTADGEPLVASDDEHADLFWAVRGGGGNFGVVTSFEYRLHHVGTQALAGMVLYSMDDAERVLAGYRDHVARAPEDLGSLAVLRLAPPAPFLPEALHGAPVVGVIVCWMGDPDVGREVVQPLRELAEPLADGIGMKPYVAHQKMLDAAQPAGRQHYWKSDYLPGLDDSAIADMAAHAREITSPFSAVLCMHLDGAGNRVPVDATAYAHRDTAFVLNIAAQWDDPSDADRHVAWARNFWRAMHPHGTGGTYGNFLGADEDADRVRASFRGNYERLAQVKATYDPENMFRVNLNIEPATPA